MVLINHIGYAVESISDAIDKLSKIVQFEGGDNIICDEQRNVKIAIVKVGKVSIEFIEPLNESSPVSKIIQKNGSIPYHICFSCNENLEKEICNLKENGFVLIEQPMIAPALNNKRVAFMYSKELGLIELLEDKLWK